MEITFTVFFAPNCFENFSQVYVSKCDSNRFTLAVQIRKNIDPRLWIKTIFPFNFSELRVCIYTWKLSQQDSVHIHTNGSKIQQPFTDTCTTEAHQNLADNLLRSPMNMNTIFSNMKLYRKICPRSKHGLMFSEEILSCIKRCSSFEQKPKMLACFFVHTQNIRPKLIYLILVQWPIGFRKGAHILYIHPESYKSQFESLYQKHNRLCMNFLHILLLRYISAVQVIVSF